MFQIEKPGRPAIDDRPAIAEVRYLLETGKANSWTGAAKLVARSRGLTAKERGAFVRRLQEKRSR
jgi:hypothetical protein